jgi:TonB family protein
VDWVSLTDRPVLLNREELTAAIRRNYPPMENAAGREADVGVDVYLDDRGRVTKVNVIESAGRAFDEAARKAMAVARFSPAKLGAKSVPITFHTSVGFRLSNDGN